MRIDAPDSAIAKVREWNTRVPIGTLVCVVASRPFDAFTASLAFLDDFSAAVVRVQDDPPTVSQRQQNLRVVPLSAVRVLA